MGNFCVFVSWKNDHIFVKISNDLFLSFRQEKIVTYSSLPVYKVYPRLSKLLDSESRSVFSSTSVCYSVQRCDGDSHPLGRCLRSGRLPALHPDARREQTRREFPTSERQEGKHQTHTARNTTWRAHNSVVQCRSMCKHSFYIKKFELLK